MYRCEQRDTGQFVYVEVGNGVATMVAAWMLNPVVCAGMMLGTPRVTVRALLDLHRLLVERGFGASSQDDSHTVQEERSDQATKIDANNIIVAADGAASAQPHARLDSTSGDEPERAVEGALVSGESVAASRRRGD
ncbi:MAG: hypothetical protein HYU75_22965 [Betaproteobacteria bacterium]|nr:hypothetical protein [Betaproteobacteria bacterium]